MSDENRSITDEDARAIASELKRQILADFQQEAGKGFLAWVWKAILIVGLILAVQGITGDRSWLAAAAHVKGG